MFDIKITERTHLLLKPYIEPGDYCIDATLGNGNDALFLYRHVGKEGVVIGVDIQKEAVKSAEELFSEANISCNVETGNVDLNKKVVNESGVYFYQASHDRLDRLSIEQKPKVIMFNLGYLPNAGKMVTTISDTTLKALKICLTGLMVEGILSVITYPGHETGQEEHDNVMSWLKALDTKKYEVLSIYQTNRSEHTPVQHLIKKRK